MNKCSCSPGCAAPTQRTLATGHDMVMLGWLKEEMERGASVSWAKSEALSRGATAGLMKRLEITIRRGGFT